MQLHLSRVVLFTDNMERMAAFYRDVLRLPLKTDTAGWKEFDAGGCGIALHSGRSEIGKRPPKLAFDVKDVAKARAELIARGAKMGTVSSRDGIDLCDGKDPDGNIFSLTSRG